MRHGLPTSASHLTRRRSGSDEGRHEDKTELSHLCKITSVKIYFLFEQTESVMGKRPNWGHYLQFVSGFVVSVHR